MKFPDLLPPGDLLKQVEGIESGLRQRKRLGLIGLLATLAQVVFLVAKNEWFLQLFADGGVWFFIGLAILVVVVLSIGFTLWARFWIKESQEPFRYTYSIADFKPVLGEKGEGPQEAPLSFQMSHDLSERLNQRIKRLSLLDEADVKPDKSKASDETKPEADTAKRKSHIHIRGNYVIRLKPDGEWFVEVMPRVRIGPSGSPETLAHPVKFKLPKTEFDGKEQGAAKEKQTGTEPLARGTGEMPPAMTARQYEQILERVYFSVATEIYKQIQEDVKRKIELLPTKYYRAVALFHEAEDYANSNTLDAYKAARDLYDEALIYFDPDWRPPSKFFLWRQFQMEYRWMVKRWSRLKRRATVVWTRLGRVELMCARAEIGYANMLLYRRALAALSGQRVNASFDARRVALSAVERVGGLSEGVKDREPILFDAHVTLALAWFYLGSSRAAEKSLNAARALNPVHAEMNSRYLFVSGEVEPRMRSKLHMFRHAVELDPRFEVAQFSLANQVEKLWRTRPSLERNVAETLFREYDEVLRLNPGNIGAWARQGYIRWLLAEGEADVQKSREAFEDGREYKEIKRETFVAELDYGLSRIAAEEGDFATAYRHYSSAVSAHLAQGMKYGGENLGWSYQIINETLLRRIVSFKETFEGYFDVWAEKTADGVWRSRSIEDVVSDLTTDEKRDAALRGIEALIKSDSTGLDPADKEPLEELTGDADLRSPAEHAEDPSTKESPGQLPFAGLAGVIRRNLPTLRVRKSVYAFVLTQYGEACNNYYYRSGDATWAAEAQVAFEEARKLNPQYVIPRYRLCQLQMSLLENPELEKLVDILKEIINELEKIVDIEPEWSDGILALAETRARLAKEKSKSVAKAMDDVSKLSAEATELAKQNDAKKAPNAGSGAAQTVGNGLGADMLDDPRAREKKIPDELKVAKDSVRRLKHETKELAKQAVDGIRKLLPFKWAENALNEELQQSGREHSHIGRNGKEAEATQAGEGSDGDSRSSVASTVGDSAGKGISALLENKEIRWEKQMEDAHVRALKTWGEIRPLLSEPREELSDKGRIVLRGEEILCHIRHHFWPDDFQLHLTLRDLSKPIFRWEAVPGNDAPKLRQFLACLLDAKWLNSATVERDPNDASTITLSKNTHTLILKLDEGRDRVCLIPTVEVKEIDDRRFLCFSEGSVNWDDVPGSDETKFRKLLGKSIGAGWVKKAALAKGGDDSTLTLSDAGHSLSLEFDSLDSKLVVVMHKFKLEKIGQAEREVRYLEYRQTSNEVICDAINRDWHGDRSAFFVLTWITDDSIDEEARRRILGTVSSEDGLGSPLYRWIGDQWFRESIAALEEFKRAAQTKDQSLAQASLAKAGNDIGAALNVYAKALDASHAE